MNAFISCDPSTGSVIFTRPVWPLEKLHAVCTSLAHARQTWQRLAPTERAAKLINFSEVLIRERLALASIISLEVGKRTAECLAEIDKSIALIRYYAERAPQLLKTLTVPTYATRSEIAFEPLGLLFAIMPWNYPVWQALRFAVPALMAGNACLIKPAPSVALSNQKLLESAQEAELDVLDIAWINHDQAEEAIRLADAVAFTGSSSTGKIVASLAGKHLKKTVLELGGSNPFIVLADANIKEAAHEAAYSRFRDAGQSCNAAKRMIVVPEIADDFAAALLEEASQLRPGPPHLPDTTLAPLARADLRANLHGQVLDAIANNARLCIGGEIPAGAGFFYPATVLDHVTPACRVYHEEVFGPVASIIRAQNEEDALRIANDTIYGLGATLYTANEAHAWELAQRIDAGSIFINRHTSSDLRLPFGGIKASGYGRELSEFGLYEFVNIKSYWQK